jgi:sarcosine oxidase subunit alpha
VTLSLDGRSIVAEQGEPLAIALLAAGERTLARSPKLHRPRGPSCLRGGCDGCLARLDGTPNVMLCLRDASGGECVEAQNVLGTRELDLLRVTDWFFPNGIDHHELLAGVPGASDLMQTFARQLAGIGRLPDVAVAPTEPRRSQVDVLVVGGSLAGLRCALELARLGHTVALVDEGPLPGGSARYASEASRAALERARSEVESAQKSLRFEVHSRHAAIAIDGARVLAASLSEPRAHLFDRTALVLATGAHDGAIAVPGNDLPGVFGARALVDLASRGVLPKDGAFIVGEGRWADNVRDALGDRVHGQASADRVEAIVGRGRVRAVRLRDGRDISTGVVALAVPLAPSFELGVQAGASTKRVSGGFALEVDDVGRAAPGVYALGSCTGASLSVDACEAHAARVARAVHEALGARA